MPARRRRLSGHSKVRLFLTLAGRPADLSASAYLFLGPLPIPFGDGGRDPKILDDAPPSAHVSARKEDTFMKNFWKKLLVRQAGQGSSATLPELHGMP